MHKHPIMIRSTFFLKACLFLILTGCAHNVNDEVAPLVEGATAYSVSTDEEDEISESWWLAFNDTRLDELIEKALANNFNLKSFYARTVQASALEKQAGAVIKPPLTAEISQDSSWDSDGERTDRATLELGLSWEIDLWSRLSSAEKALLLENEATREDLAGAALILASQVAETHYRIIETEAQLRLVKSQIDVGEKFLHLIELRFENGKASLVDIYQQRQQVASLKSQLPQLRATLSIQNNRIDVLLGQSPGGRVGEEGSSLPELPALPKTGIPADLLINRPDLRVRQKRLVAADYRVAEAVADRLPAVKLFASGGLRGDDFSGSNRFYSLMGQLVMPVIDWGKRKAEVERRKAIVDEQLALYTEAFLVAIEEVENTLSLEKEQLALLEALHEQYEIAKGTLSETRKRYLQGVSDYLPLLTALQSVQRLEQDILREKRALVSNRILLYRALGGSSLPSWNETERSPDRKIEEL